MKLEFALHNKIKINQEACMKLEEIIQLVIHEINQENHVTLELQDVYLEEKQLKDIALAGRIPIFSQRAFNIHTNFILLTPQSVRTILNEASGLENDHVILDAFDQDFMNGLLHQSYQKIKVLLKQTQDEQDSPFHISDEKIFLQLQENSSEQVYEMVCTFTNMQATFVINQNRLLDFIGHSSEEKVKKLMKEGIVSNQNLANMEHIPIVLKAQLGNVQKRVKEILEFHPGGIIELDTTINSPVKIIANNRVIADGEVIVVNENYGIQINDVYTKEID